ncbi:hypothetical protein SLA2020_380530 [Shorea laevis]
MSVCKEDGTRVENPTEVKEEIVGFFQRLLSEVPSNTPINQEVLRKAPPRRLTPDQCNDLLRGVTEGEIKDVLFSLKDNKAPGPDGYNALFFKKQATDERASAKAVALTNKQRLSSSSIPCLF